MKRMASLLIFMSVLLFAPISIYAATQPANASTLQQPNDTLNLSGFNINSKCNNINTLSAVLQSDSCGVALKWMSTLFGKWVYYIGVSSAPASYKTSVTLFTVVAYYANYLALLFAMIILAYTYVAGALNTAGEGELFGKRFSSIWMPIKISLGLMFLVPNFTLGNGFVSPIQAITLALALVGSNAGDFIWNQAATAIVSSDPSFAEPSKLEDWTSLGHALGLAICTQYKAATHPGATLYYGLPNNWRLTTPTRHVPSYVSAMNGDAISTHRIYEIIKFGPDKSCGQIIFPQNGIHVVGTGTLGINLWEEQLMHQVSISASKAWINMFNRLIPIARDIVAQRDNLNTIINDYEALQQQDPMGNPYPLPASLMQLTKTYTDIANEFELSLFADAKGAVSNSPYTAEFKDAITGGGWGQAGVWYLQLSRYQNVIAKVLTDYRSITYTPDSAIEVQCSWEYFVIYTCNKQEQAAQEYLFNFGERITNAAIKYEADLQGPDSSSVAKTECNEDPCDSSEDLMDAAASWVATTILRLLSLGDILVAGQSGSASVTNTNGMTSPYLTATGIGHGLTGVSVLVSTVADYLLSNKERSSISQFLNIIGDAVQGNMLGAGLKYKFRNASMYVIAQLIGFAAALGAYGMLLGYALPFMPVLVWISMMIGYLMMLMEALVGAPLAAAMLMIPEGTGISGQNAQRAMGMLAAIILTPSLMIIGLIASISIGYVGFSIFNQLFWVSAKVNTSWGLFECISIISVYVTSIFMLNKQFIMFMANFKNQVLTWMIPGSSRSFGEQEYMLSPEQAASMLDSMQKNGSQK